MRMRLSQGTLAKSGTSDFLATAESSDGTGTGNLIGAFGLGFYSSFLVADRVHVASLSPKTEKTPDPIQHVFSSTADDNSFEIFPDPRGNTLGRGTEVTLYIKPDALEYLDNSKIIELMYDLPSCLFHDTFVYLMQQQALLLLFFVPAIYFRQENGRNPRRRRSRRACLYP